MCGKTFALPSFALRCSDSDFLVGFIFSSISPIFPVLNFTFHGGVVLCVGLERFLSPLAFVTLDSAWMDCDGARRGGAVAVI